MAFTAKITEIIANDKTGLLGKHSTWERVLLSEVASLLNGAPFDSSLFSTSSGVPLIRIRDVVTGETSTYYTGSYEETYLVQSGNLLIGMDGDFNSAYWRALPALLNQRVCKVMPNEEFYSKKFLGYVLPGYLSAINANTPSVTVKHLSSKTIGEIELPLPPRDEQNRVVKKLEELLSDLDAGVAEFKSAQKKLGQYRQSLLKAAMDGSLTSKWRKPRNHCSEIGETGTQLLERILVERRARWEAEQLAKYTKQGTAPPRDWRRKYTEPVQPDTADLPKLPVEWVWASAEQLSEFITKGTTPPKGMDDNEDKTVPFLRVTNLTDTGELNFSDRVFVSRKTHHGFLARSRVYPKDVLMNIVGPPLGQVSVVPSTFDEWNINQAIAIFRAVDGVLPYFISSYLLSPIAQQWLKARAKTTAGQTNLTLEVCRSLPVPLPALAEQEELITKLDDALKSIVDQEAAISLGLKQAVAQRKNILKAAFAGQLVPQNFNDEPASVLLKRIRSEREEIQKFSAERKRKVQQKAAAVSKTMNEILEETSDSLLVTKG